MIAGAFEYDDRPGPQRDAMVEIIAGWNAELLKAIRQAIAAGHLRRDVDARQMAFEMYGLMLAMHQDARLLRSADSVKRARAGLAPTVRRRARGADNKTRSETPSPRMTVRATK